MNVVDCFQDLRDWKVKVGSPVNVEFLVRYTFCASDPSEDFSPGPVDGSSFSLHRNPLGNPSPTPAWLTPNVKYLEDYCLLLQLIQERESFANWCQTVSVNGDNTERKVLTCVRSSSAHCSFLVAYRWEIRKETKNF